MSMSERYHTGGYGESDRYHTRPTLQNPTRVLDALTMADQLMAGDKASFKAGYTRENAELAAIEMFGLDDEQKASFLRIMAQKHGAPS